jgi:hypothetical protein
MDNYGAIAYAIVALKRLELEDKEVNEITLKGKMMRLMDDFSEKEITMISEGAYKTLYLKRV